MIDLFDKIYLSHPLWLLAWPAPWLVWRFLRGRVRYRLGEFIEPRLWHWVIRPSYTRRPRQYSRLFASAWILSILAISGPYLQQETHEQLEARGIDITIIVDISPSMGVKDVKPNRLQRAKFELHDFINRLAEDRVALLAYSASAYRLLPLTSDYSTVRHFINALDTRLTRQHGSNLTQALETASQLLQDSSENGRAIILLTDGETHDADSVLQAGARLGVSGIPIYILGVGTTAGGPVYNARGQFLYYDDKAVISRLDTALLASLAQQSGGIYTSLRSDDSDWDALFSGIQTLNRNNLYQVASAQRDYPLFPWILGVGLALFLWSGMRRIEIAALILIISLPGLPHQSMASPWQEQQAYESLQTQDYERAASIYQSLSDYQGYLGQGVAAYRLQQWSQAASAFEKSRLLARSESERAKAAYNLGNTLARQDQLDAAAQAYREALQWQNNYPRATLNLNLVNQARQLRALTPLANDLEPQPRQSTAQKKHAGQQETLNDGATRRPGADSAGQSASATLHNRARASNMTETPQVQPYLSSSNLDQAGMIVRLRIGEQDARYGEIMEKKPW